MVNQALTNGTTLHRWALWSSWGSWLFAWKSKSYDDWVWLTHCHKPWLLLVVEWCWKWYMYQHDSSSIFNCCIPWVLLLWFEKHLRGATMQKSLTNLPYLGEKSWPYCWWKTSCTTWDVANLVSSRINYQPQLVSLPDFWTIFPVGLWWWDRKGMVIFIPFGNPPRNGSDCKGIRRGDGNTACISVFWYPYQLFNLASIICSFSTYIMVIYICFCKLRKYEKTYIFLLNIKTIPNQLNIVEFSIFPEFPLELAFHQLQK